MPYVKKGAQTEIGRKIEMLAERLPYKEWYLPNPYNPASYIMPLSTVGRIPKPVWPRTKTWEEALQKLTSRIHDRIRYGIREELVTEPSRRAAWSNQGYWYTFNKRFSYKPGDIIKLDANEIVVPEKFIGKINNWFKTNEAPALPLFGGSFEATKMGKMVPSFETLPENVIKKMEQVEPIMELHKLIGGIKKSKLPIQ